MDCPICSYPIAGKVSKPQFESTTLVKRVHVCGVCGAHLEITIEVAQGASDKWSGKRNVRTDGRVTYCATGCGTRLTYEDVKELRTFCAECRKTRVTA